MPTGSFGVPGAGIFLVRGFHIPLNPGAFPAIEPTCTARALLRRFWVNRLLCTVGTDTLPPQAALTPQYPAWQGVGTEKTVYKMMVLALP